MSTSAMLRRSNLERIGLCASCLCAVHCVLVPFLLAAQPFFRWIRISRALDNALLTVAVVIGLWVCMRNISRHRDFGPVLLLFAGFAAVVDGRVCGWQPLITGGPLVMAYALWLNRRLCACDTCHG
jgi:ABC-type tungstate transport system substrate-binding protein